MIVAASCGVFVAGMVGMAYASVPFYDWFCRRPASAARRRSRHRRRQAQARPHHHGALRRQCDRRPAVALRAGAEFDRGEARRGRHRQLRRDQSCGARDRRAGGLQRRARRPPAATSRRSTASASPSSGSAPGEKREMPVVFYVDSSLAKDGELDDLNTITLSYSFYPVREPGKAGRGSRYETGDDDKLDLFEATRHGTEKETMADAHAKHHDYHLVDPSPWPIVGSVSAFILAIGLISWMHKLYAAAPLVFAAGAIGVLYTMVGLVARRHQRGRAQARSHPRGADLASLRHDPVHRLRGDVLRRVVLGLFLDRAVSGRHASRRCARDLLGGVWPPKGIETFDPWHLPLLEHADPAHLGHHRDLGASRAAARRPAGSEMGADLHHRCSASRSPACRPTSTATRLSTIRATSMARPSSWRPASTARM